MQIKMQDGNIIKVPDNYNKQQIDSVVEDYHSKSSNKNANANNGGIAGLIKGNKSQQQKPITQDMGVMEQGVRTVFPRLSEASPNEPISQRLGKSFQDLLSLPGRVGATYSGQIVNAIQGQPTSFRDLPQQIQQTGSKKSIVGDIVRQPSTIPSFMVPIAKIPQGIGKLATAGKLAYQGAKVGGVTGLIDQMQNVSSGQNVSPVQLTKDIAAGAVLSPLIGGAVAGIAKAPEKIVKGLAAVSQKLSIPGEFSKVKPALEAFGIGKSKSAQGIIEHAGEEKALELGQKIYNTAQKIAQGELENKVVKSSIKKLPEIKTEVTVNKVNELKYNPNDYGGSLEPWQIKINEALTGLSKRLGSSESMTAEQFLNRRKAFDKGVKDIFGPNEYDAASEFAKKMKDVRKVMQSQLINAAKQTGNTEYSKAMKNWSNNIQAADEFLNAPGGQLFKSNPQSALSNLFGKNKTEVQKAIKKIELLSGEKLLEPAKYNYFANILGMEAGDKSPVALTKLSTGMGLLPAGGVLQALMTGGNIALPFAAGSTAMALGSPRVASALAAGAKGIEKGTKKAVLKSLSGSQKILPALNSGRQVYLNQQNREQK